jgi:integrase
MPGELTQLLREHRDRQNAVRLEAGDSWKKGDWVFTSTIGEPLSNISDYRRWKALIKKAGVRDARLHDARHTAATTLLLLGVSERAVIDIMGWSTGKMTLVYQHITGGVRKDVADKVGGYIWSENGTPDNASPRPVRTVPDKGEQP